jgi:hypothetical protein
MKQKKCMRREKKNYHEREGEQKEEKIEDEKENEK